MSYARAVGDKARRALHARRAYYMNIKKNFRILKKCGRDSHKGHFLGGSHKFPLLPKICDCNTWIEKSRASSTKNKDKFNTIGDVPKMAVKYMFIYINVVILTGSKIAKLGSKIAPNPEVGCANLRKITVQKLGSDLAKLTRKICSLVDRPAP